MIVRRIMVGFIAVVSVATLATAVGAVTPSSSQNLGSAELNDSGAAISGNGEWIVLRPASGGVQLRERSSGAVTTVDTDGFDPVISDDGRWVAFSDPDGQNGFDPVLWDRETETRTVLDDGPGRALDISISDDGSVVAWDQYGTFDGAPRQAEVWRRATDDIVSRPGRIPVVSGNGGFVAMRRATEELGALSERWDLQTNEIITIPDHLAISDDGRRVLHRILTQGSTEAAGLIVLEVDTGSSSKVNTPVNADGVGVGNAAMSGDASVVIFRGPIVGQDSGTLVYHWRPADAVVEVIEGGDAIDIRSIDDNGDAALAVVTNNGSATYQLLSFATGVPSAGVDVEDLAKPQLTDQIRRLFSAYFLREPDANGLAYWTRQRASGVSLAAISDEFAVSDEFINRYGELDGPAFIDQIYLNVLGRPADSGGRAFWISELERGLSRGTVMLGFSEAPEYLNSTGTSTPTSGTPLSVWRLYQAYFLRSADQAGLDFWVNELRTGSTLTDVSNAFASTAEFTNRYGQLSDEQFVDLVYQNVLGRAPDAEGRTFWLGELSGGVTRGEMMTGFSESVEFILATDTLPA